MQMHFRLASACNGISLIVYVYLGDAQKFLGMLEQEKKIGSFGLNHSLNDHTKTQLYLIQYLKLISRVIKNK